MIETMLRPKNVKPEFIVSTPCNSWVEDHIKDLNKKIVLSCGVSKPSLYGINPEFIMFDEWNRYKKRKNTVSIKKYIKGIG